MVNFNLKKNIIFPIFYEHKNTQLKPFLLFWKLANFRVLQSLALRTREGTDVRQHMKNRKEQKKSSRAPGLVVGHESLWQALLRESSQGA
jgi:hypothetical protein